MIPTLVSVVIFLVLLYSGYLNGLFSSVATLFMLLICISIAMGFYVPLSSPDLMQNMGPYAAPICLLGLFLVSFFLLQAIVNVVTPPDVKLGKWVNKLGGLGVAALNAYLATGFIMTAFFLFPWTGVSADRYPVMLRADRAFVQMFGRLNYTMNYMTGGSLFPANTFWEDLATREADRLCYSNLESFIDPLSAYYDNLGSSRATEKDIHDLLVKKVGEDSLKCPANGEPYVILALRTIPYDLKDRAVEVYDARPSHRLNGKPARMGLYLWRGSVEGERIKVRGVVECVPEEKFQENPPATTSEESR